MATQSKDRRLFHSQDNKEIEYEELTSKQKKIIQKFLVETYGIDKRYLDNFVFLKRGKDVWITTKTTKNILKFSKNLKINSIGMRAIRNAFEIPKITTDFAIFLNDKITKNYYNLTKEELNKIIHGYDISIPKESFTNNYLILKYNNEVFGVGLLSDTIIKNQIPKGRTLKNQTEE